MRKSLQTRLTVYFIALVLIPLLIVGAIVTWQTYRSEVPHALESQDQIAQRVAEQVRSFIEGRETELHSLTDINDFSNATREEQTVLLSNLFSDQTVYEELILTNGQGRELIFLSRLKVVTPGEFSNRAGSEEFDKPKETNATYFSPVSFNEVTGEPYMVVSVPLLDLRSGKLEYVLIAKFRFKSVWDLMAQAGVTGESAVYMTDNNGFVVAHANPSFVLKRAQITPPAENSFTTGLSGTSVALAFSKIAFGDQTFYVLSEQPASEALSLAFKNIILTIITTLLAIVVAGFLGVLAARQITTPIAELATTAQLISEGDLTTRTTQLDNEDEIGALATAFNRMTSQLRDLIGSLEQRVAERTKALSASAEVSRRLTAILNPQQLADAVVNQVQTTFNYYYSQIYLFDQTGENLVLIAGTGEAGAEMIKRGHALPKGRGLVGRAAETKSSILVSDTSQDPNWLPNELLPDTKAEAVVPIMIGDQVLGVLDVQDSITNDLFPEDVTLLESLASQVAISLQNARLFSDAQKFQDQFSLAVDGSNDGIWDWDLKTNEVYFSPRWKAIVGYGEDELNNGFADFEALLHPEDKERALTAVNDYLAGKLPIYDIEFRFHHKDGSYRWIRARGKALRDASGAPYRMAGSHTDITESKQTQQNVTQRARQQEAINLIAQKIQAAPTVENALQVAARELGHALGMKATVVSLDSSAPAGEVMKKKEIA